MGTLYWITGFSGAGKTTIGQELYKLIKQDNPACAFLDGDKMREVFGNDLGYCKEDRFKSAMRFARLSEFLTSQGIDVVCCTVSMFDDRLFRSISGSIPFLYTSIEDTARYVHHLPSPPIPKKRSLLLSNFAL